ncbi:MAG: hypothetical protein PHF89_00390 [Eubacteriales bacterium]|jgi:hypothetical protein|nr:hypothetical protein [Eubacteriales bacterium]
MGNNVQFHPPFTTPAEKMAKEYKKANEVSVGEWLLTFLLVLIPIVNIIMICAWSFRKNVAPSKRNFGIALVIISLVFYSLTFGIFCLLVIQNMINI